MRVNALRTFNSRPWSGDRPCGPQRGSRWSRQGPPLPELIHPRRVDGSSCGARADVAPVSLARSTACSRHYRHNHAIRSAGDVSPSGPVESMTELVEAFWPASEHTRTNRDSTEIGTANRMTGKIEPAAPAVVSA
jgi:hypothetical protein